MSGARTGVAVLAGVAGILSLAILILSVFAPDVARALGVGGLYLLSDIDAQVSSFASLLRIRLVLDIALLLSAYAFVCLVLYAQERLGSYLRNRGHF